MGYRVDLLGGLRVTIDATAPPITHFRTRKTALLLAYLALHPTRRHSREALVELLWPDLEMAAARDNLSGALSSLRRQLSGHTTTSGSLGLPPLFLASRDAVWLNDPETVTVDVSDFERALHLASADRKIPPSERRAILEAAAGLYRGPLLPDVYEEWALSEQTRLAQRFVFALAALAGAQEETGARDLALATARRAQQADPFYEVPYQTEMRLLAFGGQNNAARRVYDSFAAHLNRELGCRPSSVMQALAARLDAEPVQISALGKSEAAAATKPPASEEPLAAAPAPPLPLPAAATSTAARLPAPLARFWGRENEIEQIVTLMQNADGPRLLTITGPGGMGKTHLSLVAAARFAAIHPRQRVCWVPLADVSDERLFVPALQQALQHAAAAPVDAASSTGLDVVETLAALLAPTPAESGVVILLDNLEQLLGSDAVMGRVPALLRLLLERVPGLRFLVTSRRVLGLGGEQEVPLGSLPVPQNAERYTLQAAAQTLHALQAVPSVALFVERARLTRPDFALTLANAEMVAAICCRLEGVPLALEMAAAWVRTLSPAKIREQLDVRVSALQSRRRDLPPRHRSLRATVEWSWELLPHDLRDFFLHLCVFRGGFTSAAASAVGGENEEPRTLDWLARLQEHSLLACRTERADDAHEARYFFLEPVREWGWGKLSENEAACREARKRHARFFQELARTPGAPLKSEEQNCVAALNELLRSPQAGSDAPSSDVQNDLQMAVALADFWFERGLYVLAYQFLTTALARYSEVVSLANGVAEEEPKLFARALHDAGGTARYLNRLDEADRWICQAQEQYDALGDALQSGRCEGDRGTIAVERRDYEAAARHYGRAVKIGREINNRHLIGLGLLHIGALRHELGDWETARTAYHEAMEIFLAEEDWLRCVCLRLNQATLFLQEGQPEAAQNFINDGLDKAAKLDNPRLTSHLLATAAAVAVRTHQGARAVRLFASADRIIAESGAPLLPSEIHDRALATGGDTWRNALSAEKIARAQALGRADSLDEAVAYARRFSQR